MTIRVVTGFSVGTPGWVTGNAGNRYADAVSGTPTIVTTAPRTGSHHLRVNPAAGSQNLRWTTDTLGTSQTRIAGGFAIRFPSTVPTTQIAAQIVLGGNSWLFFTDASDRLCVALEGGSTVTGPTLSADTWYWVDFHLDVSANPHVLDWQVNKTAQTQATAAQAADTIASFNLGTTNSETFDVYFDDLILETATADIGAYPFGPHKVQLLTVDTGGTWTLTGTDTNFSTFTANGTLDSTFTVTEARDRTDDWPPTIGASADGWVQDAIAASDFLSSPMTSYTLGAGESVTALRALVVGWATSTTATNIRFDAYNGTTAETFFALGDPNFDNSTTVPGWVCKMLTTANYDTQGELDALELRGGWGTDANPDCGVHGWAVEVAVKEAGDQTLNLGLNTETETSPASTLLLGVATAQTTETETSQAVTPVTVLSLGQPSETESVAASTVHLGVAVGLTTETETGQAVTPNRPLDLGLASETETSQATTTPKDVAVGLTSETETSQATTAPKDVAVGQATETESAQTITAQQDSGQTIALGQVVETESSQATATPKDVAVGLTSETESSTVSSLLLGVVLGQTTEAESSQTVAPLRTVVLGLPAETETSPAVTFGRGVTLGQPTEVEFAQALTVLAPITVVIGQVVEGELSLVVVANIDVPPPVVLPTLPPGELGVKVIMPRRRHRVLNSRMWI